MNNLFDDCKTESDIMKRIFELSASKEFSRPELISMADKKRAEINSSQHKIKLQKVIVPENLDMGMNMEAKTDILLSSNPKGSTVFEFMGGRVVRF